jgi:hypothetical protein
MPTARTFSVDLLLRSYGPRKGNRLGVGDGTCAAGSEGGAAVYTARLLPDGALCILDDTTVDGYFLDFLLHHLFLFLLGWHLNWG